MTEKYNEEKHKQLGMNASTASARLVKDTLYKLIVQSGQNKCHQCGEGMSRETFSIEHKTPWLHSEDPLGLFFDQDNIAFSHLRCNIGAARRTNKLYDTPEALRVARNKSAQEFRQRNPRTYNPEARRAKYQRNGT